MRNLIHAPIGATWLGLLLILLSICSHATPFLPVVERHDGTRNMESTDQIPKCELVQRALSEAEHHLSVGEHRNLGYMLAKLNSSALSSNQELMGAADARSLVSKLRQQSSELLNDVIQSAASEAPNSVTKEFLRTLRLCARCNDYERVGENFDGGYVICADELKNSGLVGAYSYGINGYDGWGMNIAQRFKIPLFEYDCFDHRAPEPCAGCDVTFFPKCIRGNNQTYSNMAYGTFTEHIANNGQDNSANSSIMLKIDVEGAEWKVFAQENKTSLRQVRQITTELHGIGNEYNHPLYLKAMRSLLDAGFAVTHLHGNNHGPMLSYGPYTVPAVLEVSLIRRSANASRQCPDDIPYSIPEDQRCNVWKPELPNAILPS
jgi:hypothetical protein